MQQPAIATALKIAVDCAAKHQCFTRSDGEGNEILVLKPEVFFERALKALFKDIPRAFCRRWTTNPWKKTWPAPLRTTHNSKEGPRNLWMPISFSPTKNGRTTWLIKYGRSFSFLWQHLFRRSSGISKSSRIIPNTHSCLQRRESYLFSQHLPCTYVGSGIARTLDNASSDLKGSLVYQVSASLCSSVQANQPNNRTRLSY